MEVLKTTSPPRSVRAPYPLPLKRRPSSSASSASIHPPKFGWQRERPTHSFLRLERKPPETLRGPVGKDRFAVDVVPVHGAPGARVVGVAAVVAENEVVPRRQQLGRQGVGILSSRDQVILAQRPAVDVDHAAANFYHVPR